MLIYIYIQSFRRIEYTFVKYNLGNDIRVGLLHYMVTLMVINIDMLNLFKSRILQSFLNFLIGAVVEDCGVFITTVFCDGLDGEVIFYHWRYIL